MGKSISKLLMFLIALNNDNKLPQSKNLNTDFELNKILDNTQISDGINRQKKTKAKHLQ
ncbi:MAG TPA: hypothetical protein VLL98_06170 [Rickettsiales bacterium]|nr:hypothetical protein [Rickettsiales bacterium]